MTSSEGTLLFHITSFTFRNLRKLLAPLDAMAVSRGALLNCQQRSLIGRIVIIFYRTPWLRYRSAVLAPLLPLASTSIQLATSDKSSVPQGETEA